MGTFLPRAPWILKPGKAKMPDSSDLKARLLIDVERSLDCLHRIKNLTDVLRFASVAHCSSTEQVVEDVRMHHGPLL